MNQKTTLFTPRSEVKPFLYPQLQEFKDAIRHAYWLHTEFNFTSDIQDFKTALSDFERNVISRAMLAISQIEVNVKTFWGRLDMYLPHAEIGLIGATFADSEARHFDAYSALLEKLGLNSLFERIHEYPALKKRFDYTSEFMAKKNNSNQDFVFSMVLFSLFVERTSLFSQFLIMMSFNKHRNMFKGLSNAIEATSKEEEIHGNFGFALYDIIRHEHPEFFTAEFFTELQTMANKAFEAELDIVDWIYEGGDLDFVSKEEVRNYIANRYNESLQRLGLAPIYEVNKELLSNTKWFDEELLVTKETDFFNKRSTDYSKKQKQISADDLF